MNELLQKVREVKISLQNKSLSQIIFCDLLSRLSFEDVVVKKDDSDYLFEGVKISATYEGNLYTFMGGVDEYEFTSFDSLQLTLYEVSNGIKTLQPKQTFRLKNKDCERDIKSIMVDFETLEMNIYNKRDEKCDKVLDVICNDLSQIDVVDTIKNQYDENEWIIKDLVKVSLDLGNVFRIYVKPTKSSFNLYLSDKMYKIKFHWRQILLFIKQVKEEYIPNSSNKDYNIYNCMMDVFNLINTLYDGTNNFEMITHNFMETASTDKILYSVAFIYNEKDFKDVKVCVTFNSQNEDVFVHYSYMQHEFSNLQPYNEVIEHLICTLDSLEEL